MRVKTDGVDPAAGVPAHHDIGVPGRQDRGEQGGRHQQDENPAEECAGGALQRPRVAATHSPGDERHHGGGEHAARDQLEDDVRELVRRRVGVARDIRSRQCGRTPAIGRTRPVARRA